MAEKLLTISIASYNAEKTLEKAVLSCIVSDIDALNKLEIIIVNDGSKDNTLQLAKRLSCKYNCIKVINKQNGGYGSTVNASIKMASGKYFRLLDADDWYDTEELLRLIRELDSISSDMVVTNYTEVRDKGNSLVLYRDIKEQCNDFNRVQEHFSMHSVIYKTQLLKDKDIQLDEGILYTDTEFVAFPMLYVNSVTFLPYNVYQYSLYGGGQSVSLNSRIKHINDARIVVERVEKCLNIANVNGTKNNPLKNKMVDISKFYVYGLLLSGNRKSKEELKKFESHISKNLESVYKETSGRIIDILRITKYRGYYLNSKILKIFYKE